MSWPSPTPVVRSSGAMLPLAAFSIEKERLLKIVSYCEMIAGSEKKYGFFWLFHHQGLRIFVTDGSLRTVFQAKGEYPAFERAYQFPIRPLKLFLQERSVDTHVNVLLGEESAIFRCDNEVLSLRQGQDRRIEDLSFPDSLCTGPFKAFMNGIDFATISLPMLDRVFLVDYDGQFAVVSVEQDSFALFNSEIPIRRFEDGSFLKAQIPYASIRHFVKACSLIDVNELKIGVSLESEEIYFQTAGAVTALCMKALDERDETDLFRLLHVYERMEPVARVDSGKARKLFSKALRLSDNGILNLSRYPEELEFWISKKTLYYSVRDSLEPYCETADAPSSIQFYGKMIKSSLNRITTKKLCMFQSGEFIGFGDENKRRMAVVRGKKVERSWNHAGLDGTHE